MTIIRPWQVMTSHPINNYKIFETRTDRVVSPRTGQTHDVYIVTGASESRFSNQHQLHYLD